MDTHTPKPTCTICGRAIYWTMWSGRWQWNHLRGTSKNVDGHRAAGPDRPATAAV